MRNKLLLLTFIYLMHFSFVSNKTIFASNEFSTTIEKINKKDSILVDGVSSQKEITRSKNNISNKLSPEDKQRNFFMRTGLLVLGTFIFLFVLFLVFRMKTK
tara:strand:- start:776 stop:1081 length:306 start_codon:yes stop_codon:yes gene_type:complete